MLRSTRVVLAVTQRPCKLGQCMTLDKDDDEEKEKNTPGKGRETMETKQGQSRTRWFDKQTLSIKTWEEEGAG